MIRLFAQPYDISATGFFFKSAEEYEEKAAKAKNSYGWPVEEFEKKQYHTHISQFNNVLRERGHPISIDRLEGFFLRRDIPSGSIKIVADCLRKSGYVRDGWHDDKVSIMAALIHKKFSQERLMIMLQGTKNKYLIEGNNWGDRFWGVANGKGKNVLGHLLMAVRELGKISNNSADTLHRQLH